MKYNINDTVRVVENNSIKKIIDFEYIEGVNLYYMSDLTSYPEENILSIVDVNFEKALDEYFNSKYYQDRIEIIATTMAENLKKFKGKRLQ